VTRFGYNVIECHKHLKNKEISPGGLVLTEIDEHCICHNNWIFAICIEELIVLKKFDHLIFTPSGFGAYSGLSSIPYTTILKLLCVVEQITCRNKFIPRNEWPQGFHCISMENVCAMLYFDIALVGNSRCNLLCTNFHFCGYIMPVLWLPNN